jgi:hypothetical protein
MGTRCCHLMSTHSRGYVSVKNLVRYVTQLLFMWLLHHFSWLVFTPRVRSGVSAFWIQPCMRSIRRFVPWFFVHSTLQHWLLSCTWIRTNAWILQFTTVHNLLFWICTFTPAALVIIDLCYVWFVNTTLQHWRIFPAQDSAFCICLFNPASVIVIVDSYYAWFHIFIAHDSALYLHPWSDYRGFMLCLICKYDPAALTDFPNSPVGVLHMYFQPCINDCYRGFILCVIP